MRQSEISAKSGGSTGEAELAGRLRGGEIRQKGKDEEALSFNKAEVHKECREWPGGKDICESMRRKSLGCGDVSRDWGPNFSLVIVSY